MMAGTGIREHLIRLVPVLFLLFLVACTEKKQEAAPFQLVLPDSLSFAGETVPMQDPEIRERLARELLINQYWPSNTLQWMIRSQRWFPMVDSILKQQGIPEDFRYLAVIESGFENVSSHKGAVGFWQLMEPTAREFGLLVNEDTDERMHPEKATVAACKLLLRGKAKFGRWTETAVSYNIGISGLQSVMNAQYSDSFYDLLINPESGRYLFRILAAKILLSNPAAYGYAMPESIPGPTFRTDSVAATIPDLAFWARSKGFNLKCFRLLNPWIRSNRLLVTDSLGPWKVKIPLSCTIYSRSGVPQSADISLKSEAVFQHLVNQKDMKALKEATRDSLATSPEFHEIKPGDNLSTLSVRYNLSMQELFRLNPGLEKNQNKIHKGQKLRIREGSGKAR